MSAVLDSEWLSELSSMELMQLFLVSKLMNHVDSSSCLSVYSALHKIFQFKNLDLSSLRKHKTIRYNSHQIEQAMIDQLHKDQEAVTATFFNERNSQASELAAEKYDVAEHFMDAIDSDEEIVVDNDPVYTCDREAIGPYCHEQFKSERELELHQKLWHSNYVTSDCKHCLRRYENQTVLKQHTKSCNRVLPAQIFENESEEFSPKPKRVRRSTLRQSLSERSNTSIKLEPPENFKNEGPMVLNLPPLPTSQLEQKKTSIPISISNRLNIPTTSSAAALTVIKAPQQVQPKVLSKKCEYDGPYCKEFETQVDLESHKLLWHGNYIPTICERCFQRFKNIDELKNHKIVCPGHPPGYDSPQPTEIIPRRTRRITLTEAEINEAEAEGNDDIIEINCPSTQTMSDFSIPVSVIKQNGALFSGSSHNGDEPTGATSRLLTNAENIALQHSHSCSCETCRTCLICKDTFKNRTGLAIHMRKRHDLNRNSMPLEQHIKIEPKTGATVRQGSVCSGVDPNCNCRACVECHICAQLAPSKIMKVVHLQNEHGIGGFQLGHQMLCRCDSCTNCPICGAVSSSQHGLKIHLAQRHGLKMVKNAYSSTARYVFK